MHVLQPYWYSTKDKLNGDWNQKAMAQTPPNQAVLSGLAPRGKKHGLSHRPPPKTPPWLLGHWLAKGSSHVWLISSSVCKSSAVRGHYFVSESNTEVRNENRLFQMAFWNLWLCTSTVLMFYVPANSTFSCPDHLFFPLSDYPLLRVTSK